MSTYNKFYYKTDFVQIVSVADNAVLPFTLTYFTVEGGNTFVASFDGTKYTNCQRQSDGSILVIFDSHNLECGRLKCECNVKIANTDYVTDSTDNEINLYTTSVALYDGPTVISTEAKESFGAIYRGYSAYDLAVQNGYTGTVSDWLASLKGADGKALSWSDMTDAQKTELKNGVVASIPTATTTANGLMSKEQVAELDNAGYYLLDLSGTTVTHDTDSVGRISNIYSITDAQCNAIDDAISSRKRFIVKISETVHYEIPITYDSSSVTIGTIAAIDLPVILGFLYVKESKLFWIVYVAYALNETVEKKVDKIAGKSLSTNDLTDALLAKLNSLSNYDDTTLAARVKIVEDWKTALTSDDADTVINTFNEIENFLKGVTESDSLTAMLAGIKSAVLTSLESETTERKAADTVLQNSLETIGQTVNDHESRITANKNNIDAVNTRVEYETNYRTSGDETLQKNIDAEVTRAKATETANATNINKKADNIPIVNISGTTPTQAIDAKKFYKFTDAVTSLTITLNAPADATIVNEYMFEFTSDATMAATLTLPSSVKWIQDITIEAGETYQVSILNNIAIAGGVA